MVFQNGPYYQSIIIWSLATISFDHNIEDGISKWTILSIDNNMVPPIIILEMVIHILERHIASS
jgi:hypothetical protein